MKATLRLLGLLLVLVPLGLPPAWAQTTTCTQTSTLNYAASGTATGDRRTATETVSGTSFTFGSYTSTVPNGQTNTFTVGTSGQLSGQSLVWSQNNQGVAGTNASTVTLTFTRPVSNLTLTMQDIDLGTLANGGSDFIDNVIFEAYVNGSTTATTLTSSNFTLGSSVEYVSGGQVRGKANVAVGNAAGNLTARMPDNVTRLVVRYLNTQTYTAGNLRLQTLGINSISWCAQSDIYARFTAGPTTATAGETATYTVEYGNIGPDVAATNVARTVTLPAGAVVTSNGGGTVSGNTINFGTVASLASGDNQAFTYSYTVPATTGSYSNVATVSGTTSNDPTANNSATRALTVWAPAATCSNTVALNYANRTLGEDWKNQPTQGVPNMASYTRAGTSYTNAASTSNTLQVAAFNSVQTLQWSVDYSGASNSSTVTYTFSRPVANLSVRVQDIDASFTAGGLLVNGILTQSSGFTDQVAFTGANGGTAVLPTLAAVNPTNTFFTINQATATATAIQPTSGANNCTNSTDATVVATFINPITTLTITYRNTTTGVVLDAQAVGIDNITWCRMAPFANNVTNASTLPTTAPQSQIDPLDGGADGTPTYTITSLPAAAAGLLYYNSTGTTYALVAANQQLTAAQAASLRFAPSSTFTGTSASFTYNVKDDSSPVQTSSSATYTIPLQYVAPCNTATATLDFSTRTANEDWKNHAALAIPASSTLTTVSTGGYTTGNNSSNTLQIGALINSVTTLNWLVDYTNSSTKSSSVTYTFSRPVSNFSVRVQDIDAASDADNQFIDRVAFTGANGSNTILPLLTKANPASNVVSISGNTATGAVATTSTVDGTVTAYFASPITSLTLTYSNQTTATEPTNQGIGIDLMSWCRLEPVANDITVVSMPNGAGQVAISTLSAAADGAIQSYTLSTIPPASQGVLYVNGVAATAGQTLTPAQAAQLTFDPAVTFSGSASFTYTATDDAGVLDQTPATYSIPVTPTGASGTPAPCATPGKDGTVAGLTVNPDTYYPSTATQTLNVGATSIDVGTSAGVTQTAIAAGDLLLVIQMQGADINATNTDAYGDGVAGGGANGNLLNANFTAGNYEYVMAASGVPTTGGTVQLATALKNSYQNAPATATAGRRRFQVIRIPQYANLTLGASISALAWNGSTGGILAVDVAGTLTMGGYQLNASGTGFRGGAGRVQTTANGNDMSYVTTPANNAQKGEGTAGTPQYVFNGTASVDTGVDGYPNGSSSRGAPGNAGGGANNNVNNSGGGGGANGGQGGRGGNNFSSNAAIGGEPGAAFAPVSSSRLILGGGGGAGTTNGGSGTPANGLASSGAAGGGIIMVRTGAVSGTGTLVANGAPANNTVTDDGNGGGGAGGSILLTAVNTSGLASITLTANGGAGGTNTGSGTTGYHGPGGGGGAGVILANGTVAAASATTGGANGTTVGGGAFGAAAGGAGVSNTQISGSIANSTVGTTCATDVTTTLTGPTRLNPGQPSGNYTATFTNVGTSQAAGVVQTVTLPAGVTSVQIPMDATYNETTRVITFGAATGTTLDSRASNSYQFSFTAPKQTGSLTLTSNVTTTTGEGVNAAANQATLTATLNMVADVAVNIAVPTNPVVAGQTGTFNVNLSNIGTSDAANPTAQVQLPAGLIGVNVTGTNGVTGSYDPTTGIVTYTFPNSNAALASGFAASSSITFTAPAMGPITATVSAGTSTYEAGQTANNVASTTLNITPAFDVSTSISGPTATVAGTLTTFTVLTSNAGPSPANSVTQTVQLPANLTDVFVSNNGTYDKTSGIVTFPTLATLANGATVNNNISFTAPSTGFTATASVTPTSGDLFPSNNTAAAPATTVSAATPAQANVYTSISLPQTNVAPGASLVFTVITGNSGPATASGVVQRVSLPTGLTGVVITGGGTYDATTGIVTFPSASLASGATNVRTITVTAPAAGTVLAMASVSSTTSDPMPANNAASTVAVINPRADVATTLQGPQTTVAGQSVTYTVTTANNGPSAATNVMQTVQISAGLIGVSAGTGTYDATTGIVTFPAIASQAVGNTQTNTITFTAPSNSTFTGTASVSSATPDATPGNNTATVTTTTQRNADVAVYLSGPATTVVGNPITYAVTTTNNGPSIATGQTTTVRLPAGLGAGSVTITGGGTYDNTTGVVTFPTVTEQAVGSAGTVTNTITFLVPNVAQLSVAANAATAAGTNDPSLGNNTSVVSTSVDTATLAQADEQTTISSNITTSLAGQPVIFTVNTINASTTTATANVVQQVALPAGLTGVVVEDGSYDPATGVVTFATLSTQAANTTRTRTITVNAPGAGPLVARASVSTDNPDATPANNFASTSVSIDARVDVLTKVSGPATTLAGASVTYSVVTLNNGPSAAANVVQQVTLPAGATNVVLPTGATRSGDVVTFATIASQAAGVAGQVTNSITFTAPAPGFDVTGTVTSGTTDTNPSNNTSTQRTNLANQAPVANAVVNSLQTPAGNTAGQMAISPLSGRDADGSIFLYTITSLPTAAQGKLYLNGTEVVANQLVQAADVNKLTFDSAAGYVGNVFFTYTAIDNQSAVSAPALYELVVGRDNSSVYTQVAYAAGKVYQNADVVANVIDVNGARYNSTGQIYSTTDGKLVATDGSVSNGLATTGTNAVPSTPTDATTLANNGLALDPATGQITVVDRTKLKTGTITLNVTTTDIYGGTNVVPVTIMLSQPLPVELVAFEAKAAKADAILTWRTASEKNNDHFVVERSADGVTFAAVGSVQGNGSTSAAHSYSLTDAGAARVAQKIYYRLRQVDTDGTESLSPVRTVVFTQEVAAAPSLYPSPATTSTTLDLSSLPTGSYQVTLLDMAGRTVATYTLGGGSQSRLEVSQLPTGSYVVTVQGATQRYVLRFVKQ